MKTEMQYSDNLDVLVALVTFLAMTNHKSNTPTYLANNLGLDITKTKNTLQIFDGLFRESKKPAENGENYFTLHLRYALRWKQKNDNAENDDDEVREPLGAEYLDTLLNFITQMVEQEQTNHRQQSSNKVTLTAARVAAGVAFISVVCSFTGILINIIVTLVKP